ncbi:PEP-CTERM sorting domain-containing protein [Aliiglaciecola sp. M165]|uniref:PEP-CTERM sorting domain-containing protein n=1 Tax=Aliiglaciecola sp. M165 TaxID=2593649 RepID=UPI00117C22FF|nr:PEP-CTERM sorting domain-containing protein [Aliiglaciecola sp. M165]TRY29228.1 PEP-CTERM sorting domain-containing protein [Aliiglaciecola sp. M165]
MKKILFVFALSLLSSQAFAVLINFDVDANGDAISANTPITDQYQAWGVTFLGLEDGNAVDINAAPEPDGNAAPSAPNVLTNCSDASPGCPGGRADSIEIFFASAASNISFMLDTLGSLEVTFNLFDSNDVLLETQSVTSNGSLFVPVSFAAAGVSRIQGLQPNNDWAWAMDDLEFDAVSVPEPGSLALLAFTVLGLGFCRRK